MLSRRSRTPAPPGLTGRAVVEQRLPSLLRRAQEGDIVFGSLPDLDAATAHVLLERGVAAVVSSAAFVTGRKPNLGPSVLDEAGVLLVETSPGDLARVRDGVRVRLHEGTVYAGEETVLSGRVVTREWLEVAREEGRGGMTRQLDSFSHNASAFLQREQDVLLHGRSLPPLSTSMEGRPVVVVGPGPRREEDLAGLRGYLREQRPVLVGVDAGARTLLDARLRPDVAVLSGAWLDAHEERGADEVVQHAREIVLHRDRGGDARPGERLGRRGVVPRVVTSDAATSDLALLLVHHQRPELIVSAGTERTMEELLDRDRHDQASSVLTRLRLGAAVVDSAAVPHLYNGRTRTWHLVLILLAALAALWVAMATTPIGNVWWHATGDWLTDRYADIQELLSP